ncbi:hypothetical protein MMAN_06440 [Mycobacterium mantenii]|uniref:Uncharacterized protein n=1 Tax=Mycobacterium mantenii TaxID=560555 RepID=A0A1X0FX41_MYCNT|nr:hypothetical protein [Mycobacterium mantenii]MCV7242803.1 hypothetical protein [Mycobacterium mantenii]ORB06363.1 hypothetical protein BST30_10340 [Mycobacterium mantenii]BBY36510.1 hypothetical protein MMAN_06440 [Mycobacterium mantenii]
MSGTFQVVVRVLPAALNGSLKWSLCHKGRVYGPGELVELPAEHAAQLHDWGSVLQVGPEVTKQYHKDHPQGAL